MNKFESSLTKMLSLESSHNLGQNLSSPLSRPQTEPKKSTQNDIYRYSYNLGKHRGKNFQRTSSVGGSADEGVNSSSRALLRRQTLPRWFSLESDIGEKRKTPEAKAMRKNTTRDDSHTSLETSTETSKAINETQSDNSKEPTGKHRNLPEEQIEREIVQDNNDQTRENPSAVLSTDGAKFSGGTLRRMNTQFSDSVPDLRKAADIEKDGFNSEEFTRFLNQEHDLAQSRPLCKLRRAARRLGVTLSAEELYHKQRRNGVCTETDAASDNRQLLRVLNKRF